MPLLVPILVLLPYFAVKSYQRSQLHNQLVNSLSQGRPELAQMSRLLERGPEPLFTGADSEEVKKLDEPDLSRFRDHPGLMDYRLATLEAR